VEAFGGGVGVDTTTGGVLEEWLLGTGDAGGFAEGSLTMSPSGFLMTIAALLRVVRWKVLGVVAVFGWGVW
jgi:hypothetical protein